MGFAHGMGHPPSFACFAECLGALTLGSLHTPVPEALFDELSVYTESPKGQGSTDSKQRFPPRHRGKGTGPAADCCVSGPFFFDYSFLCDSEDEELAGIVELCHSPPLSSSTVRKPRTHLRAFVGKTAPTRKARTQLWRTRVAKSNKQFWAGVQKGTGVPGPVDVDQSPPRNEEGSHPASLTAQALPKGPKPRRRKRGDLTVGRSCRPQLGGNAAQASGIIKELIPALRQHKDWGPCEHLALALAEAVEDYEESSLPYRVAYEILEATQGESWLDTELAAAFLEDVAAQLPTASHVEELAFVSANITTWSQEIFRWHPPDRGPLLIQELHLGDEGAGRLKIEALSKGYHLFLPPVEGPRPTMGGVATLVPINMQGRLRGGFLSEDGGGFVIVELPRVRYSLLLVNLYLRPGVGLTGDPNPLILARLVPLLKQGANWVVARARWWRRKKPRFPQAIAWISPWPHDGWHLCSSALSTGACPFDRMLRSFFASPFRGGRFPSPSCLLLKAPFVLALQGGSAPGPAQTDEGPPPSLATAGLFGPEVELGRFGRTQLHSSPANLRFAHLTSKIAVRYFTKPGGRGCARPIVHRPLMQPKAGLPWYGQEAAWWQKLLQAWEPPVAPASRFATLRSSCPDRGLPPSPRPWHVEGWGTPPRMTSFARPQRMPLSMSKSEPWSRKVAARQ